MLKIVQPVYRSSGLCDKNYMGRLPLRVSIGFISIEAFSMLPLVENKT